MLPSYHSAMVNREYLDGVRELVYYAPKVTDGHAKHQCVNPPPKSVLLELFRTGVHARVHLNQGDDTVLDRMLSLIELMDSGKLPDNEYFLVLLSVVPGASCPIFQKGWRYERPRSSLAKPPIVFFDEDNFYEGLPSLDQKSLRKNNQLRVPKKARLSQQKQYLVNKQKFIAEQLKSIQKEISEAPESAVDQLKKKLRERKAPGEVPYVEVLPPAIPSPEGGHIDISCSDDD